MLMLFRRIRWALGIRGQLRRENRMAARAIERAKIDAARAAARRIEAGLMKFVRQNRFATEFTDWLLPPEADDRVIAAALVQHFEARGLCPMIQRMGGVLPFITLSWGGEN